VSRFRGVLPYAALLSEVLVFYRKVLFSSHWGIPWDFRTFHLSLAGFIATSIRLREFPLWDPYSYCGMPFYANLQAQVYYPPTFLTIVLSNLAGGKHLADFLQWQVVLHVFLAGVFAYWLLRRLDASRAAALLGATVFQLGGFFASQTQHLGEMDGATWLPLAWLSVISLGRRFSWRWLGALSMALAMALLAGFPAMSFVVMTSSLLLAAVLSATRCAPWRVLGSTALACLWALVLAAAQLLPAAELTSLSVARLRSEYLGTGGGIPLPSLISLVAPNYFNVFDFSKFSAPWNITFLYLYCGISGLALAVFGLLRSRTRYRTPLACMTLLSLLWMLGDQTPIGKALFPRLPGIVRASIYAEPAMAAFILGVAILAGLGAHRLFSSRRMWMGGAAVVLVAAELTLAGSGRPMNAGSLDKEPGFGDTQFDGSAEVLNGIHRLTGTTDPPSRIDTVNDAMNWAVAARFIRVPSANGNDPLALFRYIQVRRIFAGGERWGRYYEVANPDSNVLSLLNVRFLLSRTPVQSEQFTKAGELPWRAVYENRGALPRFFLVSRIHQAANLEQAVAFLRSKEFNPRTVAVVEGAVAFSEPARGEPAGTVRVAEYRSARLVLDVESPQAAFLVTSEAHYPGWRAFLDGVEEPIAMTNAAFRGLPVPAGRHRVEMRFEPAILARSAAVSIAGLALLVAGVLFGERKRSGNPWISSSN
jgi:hypothetical protein